MSIVHFARCAVAAGACAAVISGCGSNPQTAFSPAGTSAQGGAQPAGHAGSPLHVTHYYVVALRSRGANNSIATGINDRGWIMGFWNKLKNGQNVFSHAALWVNGQFTDLGTLGGPNSTVGWPVKSDRGEVAGESDTSQTDPLAESVCGGPYICLGFRWKANTMTPLPPLGGNNSEATGVNNRGQAVGVAETAVHDSSCAAPQVLDYRGVIWKPNGKTITLPPIAGDAVSQAIPIDNAGDAAGASGPCGPPLNPAYGAAHAVLWKHGSAIDLGNLGGTTFNAAAAMNDRGQIVGISGLPGNTTYHAFLWQHGVMSDLGTLPGDVLSVAFGINNKGQIVGQSCDASNNCRAFIWQNGSMTDLNLLVPKGSLYLFYGGDINDSGWIVGDSVNLKTGRSPAFVAIPSGAADVPANAAAPRVTLPDRVRMQFAHHRFRPIL
jgi:probable HAF family extracellular repeat protein